MSACGGDTVAPSEAVTHGLEVRLEAPAEVSGHERFDVTLVVTNRRDGAVTLLTRTTCLVLLGIFSDGERVPFQGTLHGCGQSSWHHAIAAGESLERTWPIRAELTDPEDAPVPPGTYRVRAESEVVEIDGEPARLPDLERRLLVR